MGKSVGFIGNFKGKLGNAVGYKVSQSNSGTNQGVRVYQPNIKNPKSAAQAEQRAKYAPIFATYRALKMIIDRGNESKPYGNASRVAWLKKAFRAEIMPWFVKGAQIDAPVCCQLTQGSLAGVNYWISGTTVSIETPGVTGETDIATIGKLSTALLGAIPSLRAGDQITIITIRPLNGQMYTEFLSFVINTEDVTPQSLLEASRDLLYYDCFVEKGFGAVIVSREGANGEHLRSTASLLATANTTDVAPYDATSKEAAIENYMSSASANADWAEESIQ